MEGADGPELFCLMPLGRHMSIEKIFVKGNLVAEKSKVAWKKDYWKN